MNTHTNLFRLTRRRGSIYLAVLGVATIISTLCVGGILATRIQARSVDDGRDIADARFAAMSGMEMCRQWIAVNPSWRTNGVTNGTLSINGCLVSLSAVDTVDGDLTNLPLDPICITSIASKASGVRQSYSQNVTATPTPYDCLAYGISTAGQLHVLANDRLISNQIVSANVEFKNEGVCEASVIASKVTIASGSSLYGTVNVSSASRSVPGVATVASTYAAMGTLITTGNKINNFALGPGYNPYGAVNANGVYVIQSNTPLTISDCRILGTLVIISSKAVTIGGNILIQPARSDFPSLIITGDATFNYVSSSNLSELSELTNYNPPGVPYNGTTNTSMLDSYPSEIDGLIDIGGQLTITGNGVVRGLIINESAKSDAVKVSASQFQVIYDPKLFTGPPNFFTSSIAMTAQPGSVKQIVK